MTIRETIPHDPGRPNRLWGGIGQMAVLDSITSFAIVLTDREGFVTDWNVGAERILGWSAEEMRGCDLTRMFTPEDNAIGRAGTEMRLSLENGRADDERWHVRKDGSRFWASGEMMPLRGETGENLGFVKVLRDRTAEHRAGEEHRETALRLRESEDHYRHTVDLNPQVPWTADPQGNITSYSNRWLELTGQAPGEPLGAGWAKAIHPDDVPHTMAAFGASLADGQPVDVDYRIYVAAVGAYRWMRARAYPRRNGAGDVVQWYGVVEDIHDRRLAEAQLRESEERYRSLFESIEVGFCIVEMRFEGGVAVDYRVAEANPAFVRQTGADVTGRWVSEFAPNLERHWFETYGRVALTGKPAHFEHYADVFGRWFDVRALRTGDPAANRVAIIFSDITERRRVEQRAEAGERELRLITDALPVLISFIDADHVYRFANRAYDDWFPMPASEIVGRDVRDLLGPEAYAARKPYLDRALAGDTVTFELDWPHGDGRLRVAEIRYLPRRAADGRVDGFHVFVQDVTARKQTEAELERQVAARTAERDQIWQASSDMLCVANLDGYFVSLNPAWTTMLGWTDAEMRARPFIDLVHPDDVGKTVAAAEGLARGEAQITFENRYRHLDGRYLWLSWNAVPRDGLIYASVRDVTAVKDQAEALAQAEEALRQSQKLEAVGQLTGGVAHDFNNLLTIIRSSVDFLRRPDLSEERRTRYMDAVSDTVDRAAKLTGQLLAFARRQTLKPEVFDVGARVGALAEMLDTVTGARIRVVTDVPDAPCFVKADLSQFETALINMAVNARDAMDGEGTLTLRLTCSSRLPAIRGHAGSTGPFAAVSLTDTGSGIAPDQVARIFEPFFTTKEVGKGTGLGLSQVFGFAKQSGGDVDVESKPGRGTTFILYLPETGALPRGDDVGPSEEEGFPAGDGHRVLIVEDNVEVGRFATQILEDCGYRTTWAANAEEALDRLGSDGSRFDAVFSDVMMPGMGGIALAKLLQRRLPDLPVLLASGYSHVLAQDGLDGFELLHKPYSADQLSRILGRLVRRGPRGRGVI